MTSGKARVRVILFVGAMLVGAALLADVGPPRQLSDLSRPIGVVVDSDFSVDGQWLIFSVNSKLRDDLGLYSVPVGGDASDVVMLGDSPGPSFALSGDGSQVIFVSASGSIVSVPVAGGVPSTLVQLDRTASAGVSRVTSNDLVIFAQRPLGETRSQFFSVPLGGGAVTQISQLPNSSWRLSGLAVTPDGSRIVYGGARRLRTRRSSESSAPVHPASCGRGRSPATSASSSMPTTSAGTRSSRRATCWSTSTAGI